MCFAIALEDLKVGSFLRRFSAADLSPDGCARRAPVNKIAKVSARVYWLFQRH